MKTSKTGQFYGQTNQTLHCNGITLTDTVYTHDKVDWHYHENAYFTFVLQGNVLEGNKKERYHCGAGSLLFHNWQEPHYNIKPEGFTRGFHVEIQKHWFDHFDFGTENLQGSSFLKHPTLRLLMYRIFTETKRNDALSDIAIETVLLETLSTMLKTEALHTSRPPSWVSRLRDILNDRFADSLSLEYLGRELGIHPVHLSRDFQRYFHCTLGDYLRKLRIEHAFRLISRDDRDLTAIAIDCGFADQSHFTRCFKYFSEMVPSHYRKVLFAENQNIR